jgi:hypothetical protein
MQHTMLIVTLRLEQSLQILARYVTWVCIFSSRAKRLGRLPLTGDPLSTAELGAMLDVSVRSVFLPLAVPLVYSAME